jgi:hypothetical protein
MISFSAASGIMGRAGDIVNDRNKIIFAGAGEAALIYL